MGCGRCTCQAWHIHFNLVLRVVFCALLSLLDVLLLLVSVALSQSSSSSASSSSSVSTSCSSELEVASDSVDGAVSLKVVGLQ